MKKILTVGGATIDIFVVYKQTDSLRIERKQDNHSCLLLQEGSKIEVNTLSYAVGGGAANSASSFQRLGYAASICCRLGNDPQAEYVLEYLKKNGLNCTYLQRDSIHLTGTSIILPSPCGNHTILAYRGSNAYLSEREMPYDSLTSFDGIYITSLSGTASEVLIPVTQKAQEHKIPVATNPGSSQLKDAAHILKKALPYIDIFILNSDEAALFMNTLCPQNKKYCIQKSETKRLPRLLRNDTSFNLVDYCKIVHKEGPQIIVVTDGKEGVYVATENMIYFHPSIPTTVLNTVGAGDAFGSCFVASRIHGFSIQESMVRGILNASSVISHRTAQEGLLSSDALDDKIKSFSLQAVESYEIKN